MQSLGESREILVPNIWKMLSNSLDLIKTVESASIEKKEELLISTTHELRGLLGNFHATALIDCLTELELNIKNKKQFPSHQQIEKLQDLFKQTERDLLQIVNSKAA